MILGAPVLWLSSRLEFERLDGPVTMTVADLIERRNPVVVAGDGLPIDDAGPRPKPRQRLDDQRKALLRSLISGAVLSGGASVEAILRGDWNL